MSQVRLENVIIMFPKVFQAQASEPGNDPRYTCLFFLPAGHPQQDQLLTMAKNAENETFPSGFPKNGNRSIKTYDQAFEDSDYYNPAMSGGLLVSCSAKEGDKPAIVDLQMQEVLPNQLWPGCLVNAFIGVSGYKAGKGGVGGWLNGVQTHEVDGEFGRFDGKPSVEQMFGGGAAQPVAQAAATPPPAPGKAATPPPAPSGPTLTAKATAEGQTYEGLKAAGWTDAQMVEHGYITMPATPSFG